MVRGNKNWYTIVRVIFSGSKGYCSKFKKQWCSKREVVQIEELRFVERRRAEGLVTRLTEVLLETIVRMSIFGEVRGTAVWTFDH